MGWTAEQLGFDFQQGKRISFLIHSVQTVTGEHPDSYPMGAEGSFLAGKAASASSLQLTSI
jgi:hypothetical protein